MNVILLFIFEVVKFHLSHHIQVQDSYPFSIGFSSDGILISTESKRILFPKGHLFPSSKIVQLHRRNTFHMEAFYADENELPSGLSTKISSFTVSVPIISLLTFFKL